jgi:hypothetical protein
MANYRRRKTGLICLFLLFSCLLVNVTIADSVNEREGSPKPETSAIQRNRPEQSLRGGSELLLPLKWAVGVLKTATIGPLVKPTVILLGKFTIIAFITAEIMAYLGLIGDSGEGLYDWALDNEERVHSFIRKWGVRPGGFLRSRLESMLQSYNALPPKAKFASPIYFKDIIMVWSDSVRKLSVCRVPLLCRRPRRRRRRPWGMGQRRRVRAHTTHSSSYRCRCSARTPTETKDSRIGPCLLVKYKE